MGKIIDWLDVRTGIKAWIRHQMNYPVPPFANLWFCFGGLVILCILVQFATGFYMLTYYVPNPMESQDSVKAFANQAFLGGLVRNLHRWSATLILFFLFIHTVKVIIRRAYQHPRELNWWTGLTLYLLMFALVITGIILPWNWRSYWETVIWTDWLGTIPGVGITAKIWLLKLLSLKNSFVLHIWLLPLALILILRFHLLMTRKLGVKEPL